MEQTISERKDCFLKTFGNDITDEIATILSTMNNEERHTILHISKTRYYGKLNSVRCISDGRKTCTNIYVDNKGEKQKCKNLRGYWWCVECTYRNPLAPTFLCSECADINTELSRCDRIIFKYTNYSRCHYNNPTPKSFYIQQRTKKRKHI
jgi:hypothetical protein